MKTLARWLCVGLVAGWLGGAAIAAEPAAAGFREAATMAEALAGIGPGTLVIFDLDNTLIEPVQSLGSDQWFDDQVARQVAEGKAPAAALETALGIWKAVQRATRVAPVEAGTPGLVRALQARRVPTMGLTARPFDLAPTTFAQLASVGIELGARPLAARDLVLAAHRDPNLQARFTQGILFSGNNAKGEMLVRLLKDRRFQARRERIVFVDDKRRNVESIELWLGKAGIPHQSFRYGAADPKVKAFDRRIADLEMEYFGKILDDRTAGALLAR